VRTSSALTVLMAVLLLSRPARADEVDLPDNALSLQLPALGTSSVAAQIEHDLGHRNLSLAAGLGIRTAAMGDYSSFTLGVGLELRRWFRQPMRGWFAAARLDAGRTVVEQSAEDRTIGSLWTLSSSLAIGYRWILFRRVELTPSAGYALIAEGGLDGRSPWAARGAPTLGLTAGWVF
jgi:hypothetical protein